MSSQVVRNSATNVLGLTGGILHPAAKRVAPRFSDGILSVETFATLPRGGADDLETVQELMRHANSRLTLDMYAQALTPAKRAAHLKLVELIQPAVETASGPTPKNQSP